MCVLSVIMEYGRDRIHQDEWTIEKIEAFRKLIQQAEQVDKILQQPHCEDPNKSNWFEGLVNKRNGSSEARVDLT